MPKDREQNPSEYSQEAGNLSIVKEEETSLDKSSTGLKLSSEGLKMGKGANVVIGSINIGSELRKRHERHYKNSRIHLIADIVMAGIIVILLITLLWLTFWKPANQINLSSQTKTQVQSGALETFTLKYETRHRSEDISIAVKLPKNFQLVETFPKSYNRETNTFDLSNLSAGSNGEIKIIGYVFGHIGSQQGLGFTFNCSNCGKNGVLNSLLYNIEESVLDLQVLAPDNFYNNLETVVKITLKNNSSKSLENIIIKPSQNWRLAGSDDIYNNQLIISQLNPQESKDLNLNLIPLIAEGESELNLSLFLEKNNILYEQDNYRKSVLISNPKLKTFLNNNSLGSDILKPIDFSLSYRNEENLPISNLNFKIRSNPEFTLKSLKLKESNANIELVDNLIIIKNQTLKDQLQLINFSAEFEKKQNKINQALTLLAETSYVVGAQSINYETESQPLKLNSEIQAEATAYFYSPQGDQIGIGPMPPIAGLPTTYWIFLDVSNFGNQLTDISVSGELAENVFWEDKKSLTKGNLRYGANNKNFVWEVDNFKEEDSGSARFAVRLQAQDNMIGETPILINNLNLSAYDTFAKKQINFSLPAINTDLSQDKLSQGQGEVQP
ncbi:MAG: hypothetical protein K9M44_05025 [Candidatus Pacebacteria bacterium]|nr:hypothetical protein [Candidatus Paceibacterota bacterium]